MNPKAEVWAVVRHFEIQGDFLTATPYGSGHINDTYCVLFDQGGRRSRYIFQRINHFVFKNPEALMQNIARVTSHLGIKISDHAEARRRVLTLIPSREGKSFYRDGGGHYWRAYLAIERARTLDVVETTAQAFQAGKAFGHFQKLLADLPAPRLNDTIPDFHNTPKRFAALQTVVAKDAANRAHLAKREIEFALQRQVLTRVLLDAKLPERVTHNDTKFNNVMLDEATGEGVCVIDLDTVMPGLVGYDFGDMVRTTTSPAQEDEKDLSKVGLQFAMFESLLRGYLSSAGDFLTPAEKRLLPFSGKLITFTIGLRFLTDFLAGDVYFKVHRDGHNLDRCRTQFKLVESIEQQEEKMNQLLETL